MNFFYRCLFVLAAMFLLSACHHDESDYIYLLGHPDLLEQCYKECQMDNTSNPRCNTVRRAAKDFVSFIAARREDPEAFGKQILAAQTELGKALQIVNKAGPQSHSDADKNYRLQDEKVKALLAVVAATSSEG